MRHGCLMLLHFGGNLFISGGNQNMGCDIRCCSGEVELLGGESSEAPRTGGLTMTGHSVSPPLHG